MEARWNDSDHGIALWSEPDALAQDVGRGTEFSAPEVFSNQGNRRRANLILARNEESAHEGLHTKDRKEVRRNEIAIHLLGLSRANEAKGKNARDRHGGERTIVLPPVVEVRIRNRAVFEIDLVLSQCDQLIGLGERQWIQQHSIHD